MARKKIVAGNWKMNMDFDSGLTLLDDVIDELPKLSRDRMVIFAPPFIHLSAASVSVSEKANTAIAAQNCHQETSGAYTGEISAEMVRSTGASWVILGHSERREYFNESDELLSKKLDAALKAGLNVIFCCGEPLDIRDAGTQNDYVQKQLEAGLFHLDAKTLERVVIAYEPIWAIGTGRTASAEQAQDMHAHIRSLAGKNWGEAAAQNLSILYGGSCKASNAAELFAQADVDGGLIGGASLKAEEFLGIIDAMMQA